MELSLGMNLTVMGWGATAEGSTTVEALMQTDVPLYDQQLCRAAYNNRIRDTQICAGLAQGGKDACQGDSGGPLIVQGEEPGGDIQVMGEGEMGGVRGQRGGKWGVEGGGWGVDGGRGGRWGEDGEKMGVEGESGGGWGGKGQRGFFCREIHDCAA